MNLLSISNEQQFGIEIEYLNPHENIVDKFMFQALQNNELKDGWHREIETTLMCNESNQCTGEIVSPILHNKIEDLKQIKAACELLKNLRAYTDDQCGGHIHFDSKILEQKTTYYQNLILLVMNYEDVLYRFAAGEDEYARDGCMDYAIPLNHVLKTKDLNKFINDDIPFEEFCDQYIAKGTTRNYGVNLRNITDNKHAKTIEFRFPNGTLNEQVWYNNINVMGLILEYAKKMPMVKRELFYQNILNGELRFGINKRVNLQRAKEFIQLITEDVEDQQMFIKQYIK